MGQLETNLQTAVANPKQIASLAGGPESVCVCVYVRLCACVYVFLCVCVRVLGPEFPLCSLHYRRTFGFSRAHWLR